MSSFLLGHGSYLLIVVVLILTGMGLPVPEEVPIITAGVLSSHGHLDAWLALVSCLVGALLGDCVMYAIGHHFGRAVVREHRWWAHFVTPEREAQMEEMHKRHGLKVLFLARFLVGLRSPVYLSAGILRMPFRRFLLIDLFCATVVIGTFFGLSYRFGEAVTRWIRNAEFVLTGIVVAFLVAAVFLFWRWHRRHAARQSEELDVRIPFQPSDEVPTPDMESEEESLAEPEQVA